MEIEENQLYKEWPSIDIVRKKKLEEFLEPNKKCCVYRVPQCVRKSNKAAYTPSLISIGPLHYGNKELMGMESQKKRYRTSLEGRVGLQVLAELKTYILDQEQSIRAHYSVTSNLSSLEYAQTILHDVVFIMELFLRKYEDTNDFLLKSPLLSYIVVDLLLLENQLPYSLLCDLYSKAFPIGQGYPSFFYLFQNFFERYHQLFMYMQFEGISQQIAHFTDLLRYALVMGAKLTLEPSDKYIVGLPYVTKLQKSGLKFKGTKDKSWLDIQFAKTNKYGKWLPWFEANELQIPILEIYEDTEILLRNLMVWEMLHYPTETHIGNYSALMSNLIQSKKDVDFLTEKGIIVNHVGGNEKIAKMFSRLGSHIELSGSCYYGVSWEMMKYYMHPWNYAKAHNPWIGTTTTGGTFLFMQAICSVIQVILEFTNSV